jgi:hypothetical protein
VEYQETHALTTNGQGLMATVLGQGTAVQNTFSAINWANTTKFLQVEVDLGNGYVDLGTQQLMSVPYALYAANGPQGATGPQGPAGATGSQGPAGAGGFTQWVGEIYGGGVVFHVYKDHLGDEHGLIASINDLSSNATWSSSSLDVVNCESPFDGMANTLAMINGGVETGSAANLCYNYIHDEYDDWYLPAIDELNLLYNSKFIINKSLSNIPGASIFPLNSGNTSIYPRYWSSSDDNSGNAWRFSFNYGSASSSNKYEWNNVRAVRAF